MGLREINGLRAAKFCPQGFSIKMRFISLGLLLILTLEGVVPTRQDESPLRIRSNTYPWGSTEGKSRDEFLDPLLDQLTVEELAQQLSLVTGASVLDQGGKPTLYNSTGGRGIGEINFWQVTSISPSYDRLTVCFKGTTQC